MTTPRRADSVRTPVSSHALLRYLERFCGVDVDAARLELEERLRSDNFGRMLDFVGEDSAKL